MAYDEFLADRIRASLKEHNTIFIEKKMMGGLCFMVDDKMCVGIVKNQLMARVAPEVYDQMLNNKDSREMDFTGKPLRGFLFIQPEGIDNDNDLDYWIKLCLDFNPRAKSSKKKKI